MVYVDHEVYAQENSVPDFNEWSTSAMIGVRESSTDPHADREQRMLYEEGETVAAEGALPLPPPCCLLDLTLM